MLTSDGLMAVNTEQQELTLARIEDLITRRRISQLKDYFTDNTDRESVERMFYCIWMDGKWPKKEGSNCEFVYKDDEWLVVRSKQGWSKTSEDWYHGMWVFGLQENNRAWVHRLTFRLAYEDKTKTEWTKEEISEIMGYRRSLDTTESSTSWKMGETIRIQGDLSIRRVKDSSLYIHEAQEYAYTRMVGEVLNEYRAKAKEWLKNNEPENVQDIDKDIDELKLIHNNTASCRTKSDREFIQEMKDKYFPNREDFYKQAVNTEEPKRPRTLETLITVLQNIRHSRMDCAETDMVNASKNADGNLDKAKFCARFEMEFLTKELANAKQTNIRMGNHVIIIERANNFNRDGEFRIMKPTKVYVIHDEHENKQFEITEGIYRLSLLERHVTTRR